FVAITPLGITPTKAYVTNPSGDSVTIVDIDTHVLGTVGGFLNGPSGISITPNGNTAYVANDGGLVNIIDLTSNLVTGTVVGSFNDPSLVAITPDGTTAYVSDEGINPGSVGIINLAINAV